jgi:endonuclease YncB( thermonuclease family)
MARVTGAVLILAPTVLAWADLLAPPEAAALTASMLAGKVWLVHAVVVRVIDGDTVALDLDLGWHTWRKSESVRLAHVDAPERSDKVRWTEVKAFVEKLLPARHGSDGGFMAQT